MRASLDQWQRHPLPVSQLSTSLAVLRRYGPASELLFQHDAQRGRRRRQRGFAERAAVVAIAGDLAVLLPQQVGGADAQARALASAVQRIQIEFAFGRAVRGQISRQRDRATGLEVVA